MGVMCRFVTKMAAILVPFRAPRYKASAIDAADSSQRHTVFPQNK
jgi:hypothetical protein